MLSRDTWGQHPTYSRHSAALTLVRKPLHKPVQMHTLLHQHDCLHCLAERMVCYPTAIQLLRLIHLGSRNWAQWGPVDTSAIYPLFSSAKARRGRKFEHKDSVQIAVALVREGNQDLARDILSTWI
uniref:Uncharacterized protein n=1 Tax=Mola mola TaxID=94237 RepID=A0A3Q3WAH6_MOLML